MLHLTYASFVQYGSSNLYDYQFVNQETLYLSLPPYTFLQSKYEIKNVIEYHYIRFI